MYSEEKLKNIRLIYEFNNDSPLFARVAESELKAGNYARAEEILKQGLEKFPNYSTPYFLCALVLAYQGEFEQAEKYLNQGYALLGDEMTFLFYQEKIAEIKTSFPATGRLRDTQPLSEEMRETIENIEEKSGDETVTFENKSREGKELNETPLEDRLDELAEKLSEAQISLPFEKINERLSTKEFNSVAENEDFINLKEDEFDLDEVNMASETLAMILESQGEIKGAVKVYQKLIEKEPEKAEAYNLKIKELEEKISSKDQ